VLQAGRYHRLVRANRIELAAAQEATIFYQLDVATLNPEWYNSFAEAN
jgi:hypothetical protein